MSKKQTRRAIIDAAIAKKYGWGFQPAKPKPVSK